MSVSENLQCVPGRKFLVQWGVKNFSMFGTKRGQSERSKTFEVPFLGDTKWYLKLLVDEPQENTLCFLCRDVDGPENVKSFYSISVCSSYVEEQHTFARESSCVIPGIISQHKFNDDVGFGLCRDLLQVECHLWPDSSAEVPTPVIPYPVGIKIVTTVHKEKTSVFLTLHRFSWFRRYFPQYFQLTLHSRGFHPNDNSCGPVCGPNAEINGLLTWKEDRQTLVIQLHMVSASISFVLRCNVHLLDVSMDKHLLVRSKAVSSKNFPMTFALGMSHTQLMEKTNDKDDLLLYLEFIYSFNLDITTFIDHTLYDEPSDLQVNHEPSDLQVNHEPSDLQVNHEPSDLQVNQEPSDLQMNHEPSDRQVNHGPSDLQVNHGPSDLQVNHGPSDLQKLIVSSNKGCS